MMTRLFVAAPAVAILAAIAQAQTPAMARATKDRPVEVELRSAARVLAPGDTVAVAIRLRPEPGWHAYWRHAGDVGSLAGKPIAVAQTQPSGCDVKY